VPLNLEEANRTLARVLADSGADFQGRVVGVVDRYEIEFRKGNKTLQRSIDYAWLDDCEPGSASPAMDGLIEHVRATFGS